VLFVIRSAWYVAGLRSLVSRDRREARVFGAIQRRGGDFALLRHWQRVSARLERHKSPPSLHSVAANPAGDATGDRKARSGKL